MPMRTSYQKGRLRGSGFAVGGGTGFARPVRRVAAGMDGLKLLDADLGVDGGGLELGVAEKLLDVADVGPAFEQVRGAGVAQQVGSPTPAEARLEEVADDGPAQHVGAEGFAVAGEEQGGLVGAQQELRAHVFDVFLQPAQIKGSVL